MIIIGRVADIATTGFKIPYLQSKQSLSVGRVVYIILI